MKMGACSLVNDFFCLLRCECRFCCMHASLAPHVVTYAGKQTAGKRKRKLAKEAAHLAD